MKRVGRYRERQYQLAAQKHNQALLKHDYYQQIARYFERECRIAKHYDSWNYRNLDPKGELEKAKKAERLHVRRNKLRNLLKEEDETYRRELEERKRVKSREEETSLEALRQKLREKRAEQSLYLPRTCRRYQSYFVCPKESTNTGWDTLRGTNLQYSRAYRDSINVVRPIDQNFRRRGSKMTEDSNKTSHEQEIVQTEPEPLRYPPYPGYSYHEPGRPVSKYSARYAHRSLENTNMRTNEPDDHPSSPSPASASPNREIPPRVDDKESATELDNKQNDSKNDTISGSSPVSPKDEQSKNLAERDDISNQKIDQDSVDTYEVESSINKYNNDRDQNTEKRDTRQFEVEKTMPWLRMIPEDKNLSRQMFLYLTHKELKSKIEDIKKRETHACNKQCWDEALRLRDMKNRLELIREKRMYHTENLDLDEESRKWGFDNIDKREAELLQREKVCTDSTMYSEDAKAMWKKWVHEDEQSVIKEALVRRENLMDKLEKEWQRLAIHEKEKIAQSYQIVTNDSALQEAPKLAAAVNAAKMKSVSSSLN
ncbi:uncharacterized protein LOC126868289 isoform X1 [Bombus huntii]|uniref:uncharacterized protein LOC126868289 isoform X1 n=1 Tax=Bombus huntii TaxID=85661 RepID=UPI0021AAC621|nr:uncharacterized protein LOC126868289 isoform X1 [Bombus huntii]XP_050479563.1 uncharacterized protein LOC126868289 isoform X1 [Bombus huntii]XP_050479565.1 uncharacterized protein LOC126868289 isoform X1 [Bombus huntii]